MRRTPQPVFDADPSGGKDLGNLPEWDLTDLYAAPDAPEVKRDLDWLEDAAARFAEDYEGKLAALDAAGMLDCVLRYEKIDIVAGRLMSYAGLRYYQQTTDADRAKFIADMQDKITSYTTPLVFFSLEINRIEDDKLDALFAGNADLARYRPVFDRLQESDVIVAEVGASPLEPYNGEAVVDMLADHVAFTVLCASDPYAVVGIEEAFGHSPDLVAGITTNTTAGVDLVEELVDCSALNVQNEAAKEPLEELLLEALADA